jgi:hypothetical protein
VAEVAASTRKEAGGQAVQALVWTPSEYVPAGQTKEHSPAELAPSDGVEVPAGHMLQSSTESCRAAEVPPSVRNLPSGHALQSSTESCRAAVDASSDRYLHAHDKM